MAAPGESGARLRYGVGQGQLPAPPLPATTVLSQANSRSSQRFGSVKTQHLQSTALRSIAVLEMLPVRSVPKKASPIERSC